MNTKIHASTLSAMFRESAERFGDKPAFASKQNGKNYVPVSYRELFQQGAALATGLLAEGLQKGDHVAILSDNRYEWILTDYGCQLAGCADVPRGTDITDSEITHILPHSEAKFVVVENDRMLQRVLALRDALPAVKKIIIMVPGEKTPDGVLVLADIQQKGQALRELGDRRVEDIIDACSPEEPFTLIYTSGTTGIPKGVSLSHANIMSQVKSIPVEVYTEDRFLTILPVWHIFERMIEMAAIGNGSCTYYTSTRTIKDDMKIVHPTIMGSTPRLWEVVYNGVLKNAETSGGLASQLFHAAKAVSSRFHRSRRFLNFTTLDLTNRSLFESLSLGLFHLMIFVLLLLPFLLLDRIVLTRIRAATGGKLRASISGGGALPAHIDVFFNDIGIPILEGYGLTETSPVLAVRTFKRNVIGTVGPLWPRTELKIVDVKTGEQIYPGRKGVKGEIHVKGPQVMSGYFKNPETTALVLQKDGWFNTGDVGMMTFNDCLKIMGRSKETIVLTSGENVEPEPIENRIVESPLIAQCMLVGQDQKVLGALVVPELEKMKEFGSTHEEIANNTLAQKEILKEIKSLINAETGFKSFERVIECRLLPRPFEPGKELNNAYKLKRDAVVQEYGALIDSMFR